MKVQSLGGLANDTTTYQMWLERPYSQPAKDLEIVESTHRPPRVSRTRPRALTMQLHVVVWGGGNVDAARETLLATLDTQDEAIQLVVTNDNGSDARYRYVVAQQPGEEQPESEGMGQEFVATLVTHGETAWTRMTPTSVTWTATASGETKLVTNGGSVAARPVLSVTPRDDKTAGSDWDVRLFVAVPWDSYRPFSRYPVELTWADGGFDTFQLMEDGDIDSEDEIGVIVDGQEVRRWVERFNTTESMVWVNLDFAPAQVANLKAGFGAGDVVASLTLADYLPASYLDGFPTQGILLIDDELFLYRGKDAATKSFLNVERAAHGSVAAAHDDDATIWWIQHEVWLVYGNRTRREFFDEVGANGQALPYDAFKPMLDLENSDNGGWWWLAFVDESATGGLRPATWVGRSEGDYVAQPLDGGDDILVASLKRPDVGGMGGNGSSYVVPAVRQVAEVMVVGRRALYEAQEWVAGLRTAGQHAAPPSIPIPAPARIAEEEAFTYTFTAPPTWGAETEYLAVVNQSEGSSTLVVEELSVVFASALQTRRMPATDTYSLGLTIQNVTTGQAITLRLETELDATLTVDTEAYTVRSADGASRFYSLTKDWPRAEMLPLLPGDNVLRVVEDGLTEMEIVIEFYEKRYS